MIFKCLIIYLLYCIASGLEPNGDWVLGLTIFGCICKIIATTIEQIMKRG